MGWRRWMLIDGCEITSGCMSEAFRRICLGKPSSRSPVCSNGRIMVLRLCFMADPASHFPGVPSPVASSPSPRPPQSSHTLPAAADSPPPPTLLSLMESCFGSFLLLLSLRDRPAELGLALLKWRDHWRCPVRCCWLEAGNCPHRLDRSVHTRMA